MSAHHQSVPPDELPHAAASVRSADDLVSTGLIPATQRESLERVASRYAVAITPEMQALIDAGDPGDPIAQQFVPRAEELITTPDEHADPIGDAAHSPLPGLVHRYPDRVLLKVIGACPVYCRFCFRREMVGRPGDAGAAISPMTGQALAVVTTYIAARPEIWEVIMTGGDPFMLSPRRAAELTSTLAAIAHVKVLRWHTRVPIVDPGRVTQELIGALRAPDATTYVAIHANHPRELTRTALAAIGRLADAGITLVSQTVLLRGVNDDADVLAELMRGLVAARVKPYYLHHPDLAPGTSRFRLSLAEGQDIVRRLRGRLSGLCQPTYVLDIPGGYGKVPVAPPFVEQVSDASHAPAHYRLTDYKGRVHAYPPRPVAESGERSCD